VRSPRAVLVTWLPLLLLSAQELAFRHIRIPFVKTLPPTCLPDCTANANPLEGQSTAALGSPSATFEIRTGEEANVLV
jgi:hypothetical protein